MAGVGLKERSSPASATHRPTELAIGMAVDAMFAALPKETKRDLCDLPGVVRRLEADAQRARQHMEETHNLASELGRAAPRRAAGAVLETRAAAESDIEAVRDLAERRLSQAVLALETIRLDLLRLHAGTGTVQSLTEDLAEARAVGEQIGRLLEGQREVETLLRKHPAHD